MPAALEPGLTVHDRAIVLDVMPDVVAAVQCPCKSDRPVLVSVHRPAVCRACRRIHKIVKLKGVTTSPGHFKFGVEIATDPPMVRT